VVKHRIWWRISRLRNKYMHLIWGPVSCMSSLPHCFKSALSSHRSKKMLNFVLQSGCYIGVSLYMPLLSRAMLLSCIQFTFSAIFLLNFSLILCYDHSLESLFWDVSNEWSKSRKWLRSKKASILKTAQQKRLEINLHFG